ncbi:MFS transporter [Rhodococcus sp. BL-253-APC-6A1W]|uniref:MFS transporter n=2 Tax=unclassified Rhodococcus (in: high G+C Gram-positive bacteria) TaxID=192944 RepID=UPI00146C0F4F|nr:MFS transporter [Rhodococcus sp. BL-253-APC-6A1W]NMD95872.1 MFS transporter [Rhodococcus sp. BL-253-APC-6A1W]
MWALALGGFGIGTTEFMAMGLLPDIAAGLGVSEPTAGHVVSAYAAGVVVGAPLLATLTARVPRKTLLIALMVAFTIGNAATVLAPGYGALVASRFVAGLPHGAYFGVAAIVAAHLAGRGQRARAVALVMMGLSVANVIGVPAASWLGMALGWRIAFGLVAVIGVATVAAVVAWVPDLSIRTTSVRTELGALRRKQVWMTLGVATIGFGGVFAVYTYISTTLTDVAGVPKSVVPVALMLFGLGMVVGNAVGGRLADRALVPGIFITVGALGVLLAVFVVAVHNPYTALVMVFLLGGGCAAVGPGLQVRLMDVADDAQTLAASLHHAAFNLANAIGAAIGGAVIAAGFGYTAPAAAGVILAAAGVLIFAIAVRMKDDSGPARGEAAATEAR